MFEHGLVVGKFYPPHKGHQLLIDTAIKQSEHVTVLVTDTYVPGWSIPTGKRLEWLTLQYSTEPKVAFHVIPDLHIDDLQEYSHTYWAWYTEAMGIKPDAVFSSEKYGIGWAEAMGATHVTVDAARERVPVSATMIREDSKRNLALIMDAARPYFVPRVVLIGAESTGTTTLAKALQEHYREPYVPEFGRWVQEKATDEGHPIPADGWTLDLFKTIARSQDALEDYAAKAAHRFVICDTDSYATEAWWRYYGNRVDPELLTIAGLRLTMPNRLYIVTDAEGVPFEDDGYRENLKRDWMDKDFKKSLTRQKHPVILATGSREERLQQAIAGIERYFND